MVDDVGRSWNDPPTLRRAVRYVVAVLILTGMVVALALVWAAARPQCLDAASLMCDSAARLAVALGPAIVLLLGGLGAFVITFREWRAARPWTIWQGAGWFLFTTMVIYLSIAGGAG
ncbi:hypothetical protein [Nocardia sp. NBC_01388]|uniref:hypothetical protein n=1 Tax=Nocardia sp. NBC_01388 TaxID=2903596 RepID=UPI003245F8CE